MIETGIVGPTVRDPFQRAYAGVLATESKRFPVMALDAGRFVCRSDGQATPAVGTKVTWYPAWALTVADGGFGPVVPGGEGVGRAQVAAVAIRRSQTRPLASPFSTPAGIASVDTVVPNPPTLPSIATGPWCAEVATRADRYGISRFTFDVQPAAGEKLVTYRALGETLWAIDHEERVRLGAGYALDTSPVWAQQILADSMNAAVVAGDLATLTLALAAAGTDPLAISAAYGALHADAQRLVAGQSWVRAGYTPATAPRSAPPTCRTWTSSTAVRGRTGSTGRRLGPRQETRATGQRRRRRSAARTSPRRVPRSPASRSRRTMP